jgi:acid phosphatase family membrane protein YuiD
MPDTARRTLRTGRHRALIGRFLWCSLALALGASVTQTAVAAGGPLGIDHRWNYDDSGIWKRKNQLALMDLMIVGEIGGGLWEGGESRLGKTYWRAIDSSVAAGVSAQVLKVVFHRERPTETDNPNRFFAGDSHASFPSGEVAAVTAIVTPFVLEYKDDHPAVYGLELLPLYDAIARMKVQAHWQTDVLAGFALGTYTGYLARSRDSPYILSVLPHGFTVGLRKQW